MLIHDHDMVKILDKRNKKKSLPKFERVPAYSDLQNCLIKMTKNVGILMKTYEPGFFTV